MLVNWETLWGANVKIPRTGVREIKHVYTWFAKPSFPKSAWAEAIPLKCTSTLWCVCTWAVGRRFCMWLTHGCVYKYTHICAHILNSIRFSHKTIKQWRTTPVSLFMICRLKVCSPEHFLLSSSLLIGELESHHRHLLFRWSRDAVNLLKIWNPSCWDFEEGSCDVESEGVHRVVLSQRRPWL